MPRRAGRRNAARSGARPRTGKPPCRQRPRRQACPPDVSAARRFSLGIQASLWHELAIVATAALLAWLIGNELNHSYANPAVFDAVNAPSCASETLRAVAALAPDASLHTPYGMTEVLPVADIELGAIEQAELDDFSLEANMARAGRYGREGDRRAAYAYHFDAGLYSLYLRELAETWVVLSEDPPSGSGFSSALWGSIRSRSMWAMALAMLLGWSDWVAKVR